MEARDWQDYRTFNTYDDYVVVLDNTPPEIAVAGGLWDARGLKILRSGDLQVFGNDVGTGVKSIFLWDNTLGLRNIATGNCGPTQCVPKTLTANVTIDPVADGWTDGQAHQLRTGAKDLAGLESVSWLVDYYWAAWRYGGLDDDADFTAFGADLAVTSNPWQLWNSLRPADKVRMLGSLDMPNYQSWAARISTPRPRPHRRTSGS